MYTDIVSCQVVIASLANVCQSGLYELLHMLAYILNPLGYTITGMCKCTHSTHGCTT